MAEEGTEWWRSLPVEQKLLYMTAARDSLQTRATTLNTQVETLLAWVGYPVDGDYGRED